MAEKTNRQTKQNEKPVQRRKYKNKHSLWPFFSADNARTAAPPPSAHCYLFQFFQFF